MTTPNLESDIFLYFVTAERTTRSNFAGTGQTRKRSSVVTKIFAEHLISRLSINWTFTKYGVVIDQKELATFLATHLWSVPDDIAKASGTRQTFISEPAAKAISHGLYLALDMEYIRSYESQNYLDQMSPRYVHRAKQ